MSLGPGDFSGTSLSDTVSVINSKQIQMVASLHGRKPKECEGQNSASWLFGNWL